MKHSKTIRLVLVACAGILLASCSGGDTSSFPVNPEDARNARRGKLTGEGGLKLFGPDDEDGSGGNSPIGVNSFLWRATLDTLSFMPITSADPFGGVILTDWYEDPDARGERFKVTALILDKTLRVDGIKVKVFKQKQDAGGSWSDQPSNETLARKLEDTILTRARELRVKQSK